MDGVQVRCLERERQALLKIKDELVDTYGRLSSWGNQEDNKDCCKWRGVQCDNRTNHITRLDLHDPIENFVAYYPLKGNVSTSLLVLQHLQYLDLSFNDFDEAHIPHFIGSLSQLEYLNLGHARFRGPVPNQIGNLSKLLHLDLGHNVNCYSESLDWLSHLRSLEYLDLSYANLSKATNWLQAISKLNSIKELHMRQSALSDITVSSLPSINANSSPLSILDLSRNCEIHSPLTLIRWFSNFSGSGLTYIGLTGSKMPRLIPDIFQNMISLEHLILGKTGLEGGIPKYFGSTSNLKELDLGGNNLTGELSELMMNLSGPIEERLEQLYLGQNKISGSFYNMSRFSSLRRLSLMGNQLSGSIPQGYLQLPYLSLLSLSKNQLGGPVPDLSFSPSLKRLFLDHNKFNGTLTESVRHLSRLQVLDLSSNPLLALSTSSVFPFQLRYLNLRNCSGLGPYFPQWLKTQRELAHLDISNAGISDIIPHWFGGIAPNKLIYMNASNNQLYGVFPQFSFSTNFSGFWGHGKILDLSRNKISGSITSSCHSKDWELLDLSDNLLSGHIPDCFANFDKLKCLNLANNNFFGKIPHLCGSINGLSLLVLRNNSFFGELPTSMGNCTNLEMIDLGQNRLGGHIPSWVGERFSKLKVVVLRRNEFHGSIPSNLCGLQNLQIIDLSSNNISGVIPDCLQKFAAMTHTRYDSDHPLEGYSTMIKGGIYGHDYSLDTIFVISAYFMWKGNEHKYTKNLALVRLIDLSSNNLIGEIPSGITKLVGLIELNLSANKLIGPIPVNIGQLKMLDGLDFSRNHLSGRIPDSLGELGFLGFLNLSCNNLSGRIPPSNKLSTFDESSYTGNSGLCGFPLNKSCPGDHKSHQDSDSSVNGSHEMGKREPENGDEFITEGFYIAFGLGFIVGFLGIIGTILFNKSMR